MADAQPPDPVRDRAPPPAPRSRWRTARTVFAAAVVAIVVGIGVLPGLLATPERATQAIAALLPDLLAIVHVDRVTFGWSGPIVLEGVRVMPRAGGEPPIRIARIEAAHGLAAILLTGGDLGTVRVERPEVDVAFDTEHRANLEDLVAPDDGAGSGGGRRPRKSLVRLRLVVDDARVLISGPWADDTWASDPINVRATLAHVEDGSSSAWTLEPVQLLTDARMDQSVAYGVLAYIAPVLADATRTSGRFSLRLDRARLPLGAPGNGEVAGVLSLHEVVLGPGPLVANVLSSLPGRLPAPPAIRVADESHVNFRLADRRVWHEGLEFGVPLAEPGPRLDVESSGFVGIDDQSLDLTLRLPFPVDVPSDRPVLAALAGRSVSVGIGGQLGAPKVNFDGSIRATAREALADAVDDVRSGNGPSTGNETADTVIDIVGGVLDEVARRRAERQAAAEADPDGVPPPRRGGLLRRQRGLQPEPEPAPR